jgi:tRNA A-37 threonylcarbamoyl transferase component Bud32
MRATPQQTRGEQIEPIGVGGLFSSLDLQRRYEHIVRRLAEGASQYFESAAPPVFSPVLSVRRPVSELVKCRVTSAQGTFGVYIKFFLPRQPTLEDHARAIEKMYKEVDITRDLYARLGAHSVYAVPRIIAFFPEERAVVMEESVGQRLLDIVLQKGQGYPARSALETLARHCRTVGGWLKHFQHLTRTTTEQKFDRADFLEYVTPRLVKLKASQRMLRPDASDRILHALERLLQQVPEYTGNVCGVHGDLSLSNILVSSKKFTVLDFSMYQIGSSYNDPAYFYSRIESVYHPLIRKSTTSYLQRAFIEGYGEELDKNGQMFRVYYIRHKINRLLNLADFHCIPMIKRLYQKYQFFKCWKDLEGAI